MARPGTTLQPSTCSCNTPLKPSQRSARQSSSTVTAGRPGPTMVTLLPRQAMACLLPELCRRQAPCLSIALPVPFGLPCQGLMWARQALVFRLPGQSPSVYLGEGLVLGQAKGMYLALHNGHFCPLRLLCCWLLPQPSTCCLAGLLMPFL